MEKDLEKALVGDRVRGVCQVYTDPGDKTMNLGHPAITGGLVADFKHVSLDKVTFSYSMFFVGIFVYQDCGSDDWWVL